MTIASFLSRRRRLLLLCVASVLLHYWTIGWVGTRIGLPQAPSFPDQPATIVAQLHSAAPALQAVAPARAPARLPRRAAPSAPKRHAPAPGAGADVAPAEPEPAPVADEAAPAALVPDEQSASAPPEQEPAAAQPAPAQPRSYKVSVPPSSELSLDVARTDADGTNWTGVAVMAWKHGGGGYSVNVEAGLSLIVARVNLLVMTSEGRIGELGFEPVLATETRRGRARTATHFNREQGSITFSASQASFPLAPGTQDKATLPLQLAAIARADPGQFDGDVEIMVGEDKGATLFRFLVIGPEEIETKLGKMQAWHLSRPPRPGAYNARLDVWLAPAHGWYPVRIRNTEASGAVTTQTISKIVITDSGQ